MRTGVQRLRPSMPALRARTVYVGAAGRVASRLRSGWVPACGHLGTHSAAWKMAPKMTRSYATPAQDAAAGGDGTTISKEELEQKLASMAAKMQKDEGFVLLDVRQPYELESLPAIHQRARLLPLQELPRALEMSEDDWEDAYDFDKPRLDDEVVCYCKSGVRSEMACALLRQKGYRNVRNYRGSALEWWSSPR